MIKKFLEWIKLKERLDEKKILPPLINEGDIWWTSLGENIGWEINGKSDDFTRPVIILKKLAHGFYFCIPTTTKAKTGSWYIPYRHQSIDAAACLHQARSIDFRRLHSKLGRLDDCDFLRIKCGFIKFYQ